MERRAFLALAIALLLAVYRLDAQTFRPPDYPTATVQFFDDHGMPVAFGQLCAFELGSYKMKTVYQSPRLPEWPHPNPLLLNSVGRTSIYLAPGGYRFVLLKPHYKALCTKRDIERKPSPVIRDWEPP